MGEAFSGVVVGRYRESVEGTPFGRYRLMELLGRGGMGEVWRAHDTTIDRMVAIKTLLPRFAQDPDFEKRFRREARVTARLEDPHVVPIYDVGEIDGRLYLTMRLIDGADLQSLLDAGPLDAERAVHVVEQVASALHSAHEAGLVHRDIKPSNILLGRNDFAYLIDFGIARAAEETGLTSARSTLGTWAYMAPERFTSGDVNSSSDIYALACVLYQCLVGEPPFPGAALEEIAVGHMYTPPPKPSEQRGGVPAALDRVIAKGLAKKPDDRYPTTIEMVAAARQAITTGTSRPAALRPNQPKPAVFPDQAKTQPRQLISGEPSTAPTAFVSPQPSTPVGKPPSRRQLVLIAVLAIITLLIVVGVVVGLTVS